MGDPDPAYAFSRYLEVMLHERFPSMKFEVANTGSVAINSHVLLPIAEELANHHPDLFIIYSGNNEVVGPYGAGTALTSSGMSLPVIRSSIFVRSTRIGQLLTKLGAQKREWGGMEMFLDKQVRASSPLMGHTYANFESNLRDTIAAGRRSGARVIVMTVASNLKDCAPFASLHREDLGQDDLHNWSALVQQGSNMEDAGSYAEALKKYLAAEQIDNQYAELEFRIADCLWMQQEYRGAKEHFLRARDLDTLRFRADTRINEINRSEASSAPGAELLDAEEVLARESPNGIIGSDLVYEHVHLTPLGNYLLARSAFLQIASKMPPQAVAAAGKDSVLSQTECERLLALTNHDRSRMATEMLRRLDKRPFTTQLDHTDQVSKLMQTAGGAYETPNETASEYQWAIAQRPNDRILHYNFGLFLFDYNRPAAIQQFRMARPWDGFPIFTPEGIIE
jgi:tetratricopeptide (TPR) repeat protein